MNKKNIAVVMGGYSSEYQISLNSGAVVCETLDPEKYAVFPIVISKEGWFYKKNGIQIEVNRADFSFSVEGGKTAVPDLIFNTIHGTPGEDGLLQAYWDLLKIPYTSCNYYAAALSFNKRDCLSVLKNFGVHSAVAFFLNKDHTVDVDEIAKKTGFPCFVKPNRSGSSYGISKVHNIEDLLPAIEKAFEEDSEIIIESALIGTEVQVGVYHNGERIVALPPTEIVTENEFFDYAAKYLGQSEEITPARISEEETEMLQQEAIHIYKLLNMSGITRSDFIIQDGKPFFLEINTTPGLSKESIIPKQVKAAGMDLSSFFDDLINHAFAKNKNARS